MNEEELKELIKNDPGSIVAQAYRLGRKDYAVEISKTIEKINFGNYTKIEASDYRPQKGG